MADIHQELLSRVNLKKAVIWDFDGVLCFGNWNYGEKLDDYRNRLWEFLEQFDPEIRTKFKSGLKYAYEHSDAVVRARGQLALDEINKFYLKKELSILPGSPMNPKILTLFDQFKPGIEHYIWSNNQAGFILAALGKADLNKFKLIVSRDKVMEAKPDIAAFELIRAVSLIKIPDFLFVGDSKNTDGLAAKKLGMDFFFYQKD